ncbi:MAG TPA: hypothetical protein VG275_04895 [Solirubrobacteraceae bacterium]|nr:hypothetical protein [Solirubrobacteraceae bacterium]
MVQQQDRPPSHPTLTEPAFIPRLGYEQQRLLPALRERRIRMTVSPLYYMVHNPELALFASASRSLGLALDPCAHHRQLPFAARSASFRALRYGAAPTAFDPDRDPVSDQDFLTLATTALELQRNRNATLMLTCAHLTGAVGTRGRDLDLELARAAIAHFRTQRMDEPPMYAANRTPREIYVTIAIPIALLRMPGVGAALADAYLALAADGYWVKLEGFDERAARADIRAGGGFLACLRDGGRPVVCCQAGQLHLGLLADGLSASIGIAEGEHFRFPTDWKQQTNAQGEARGRRRSAYHPKYLRAFLLGGDAARKAFAEASCRCRAHPPRKPPTGAEVELHAAAVRCQQAREALDGELADRREWLLATAAMATHTAHDAGVDSTLPVIFEELFQGLDDDAGQRRLAG